MEKKHRARGETIWKVSISLRVGETKEEGG